MDHNFADLEVECPNKLKGSVKYGMSKGPFMRKPFWRSYNDFVALHKILTQKITIQIPILPNKAPWYTKTKWSKKRIDERKTHLIKFLEFCHSSNDIKNTYAWNKFINPGFFDTDLYRYIEYKKNSLIEKSTFIEVHNISIDNQCYALKSFDMSNYNLELINNELKIHSLANHPSCLKCYGYIINNGRCEMILELADKSVLDELAESQEINEEYVKQIFYELMIGIYYLHYNNIVHRDIKPDNLLLMSDKKLKICDFGFAHRQSICGLSYAKCGTPYYVAQEVLHNPRYDAMCSDIYSCGVTLFVLLAGNRPFTKETIRTLPIQTVSLLKSMLDYDINSRIRIMEILTHPWLANIYKEKDIIDINSYRKLSIPEENDDILFKVYVNKPETINQNILMPTVFRKKYYYK